MPPTRVSKRTAAAAAGAATATPRRTTRSSVRAGSASLEEAALVEKPTRRVTRSRSTTPTSSQTSSFESTVSQLPVLVEEEVARVETPAPIEFAPIVDASPYKTPRVKVAAPSPQTPVIAPSPPTHVPTPSPQAHVPAQSPLAPAIAQSPQAPAVAQSPQAPVPVPSPRTPVVDNAAVFESFLSSPRVVHDLSAATKTALLIELRKEILRLRKVEAQHLALQLSSPSPEMARPINRARDLRYHMSIAVPAAAKAAEAKAAAAAAAEKAAATPPPESTPSRSSTSAADKKPQIKTPQKSPKPSSPAETPSASPSWGFGSLLGSVAGMFSSRIGTSPTKEQPGSSQESYHQPTSPQQAPSQAASSQQLSLPKSPAPQPQAPTSPTTPTPKDSTRETPVRTTRRRGVLPGSMRTPRKRDTPRQKPKEVNADRRAEQLAQAAERKRIQEQADRIEQERLRAEQEQNRREQEEAARQQAGNKRKRVRIDDLKSIPAHRPGQGSGTFCLLDEFFEQNSDEEDDYVEMDVDQIELLPARPTKKVRLDDNVFQPKAPAVQPPSISPVKQPPPPSASVPATPAPNYSQLTQQAIEKQRMQFSQHKPKQPSRLRQVERLSTGSSNASPPPLQPLTASALNAQKRATSPVKAPPQLLTTEPIPPTPSTQLQSSPLRFDWPSTTPFAPGCVFANVDTETENPFHRLFRDECPPTTPF